MSWQGMRWVYEEAPDLPKHLLGTLGAVANYADDNGCGSAASQPLLAWHARKTDRAVRNDLTELKKLGLIREGDQKLVAHLPADERPVVYDLAMERKRTDKRPMGRKPTSAPSARGTGSPLPPETPRDRKPTSEPTGSPLPTFLKAPEASSSSPASGPVAAIADALTIEEEEAEQIFNRIRTERRPIAPSRYVDALIATGDIRQFRTKPKPATNYTGPRCDFTAATDGSGLCATCHMPKPHARHGAAA